MGEVVGSFLAVGKVRLEATVAFARARLASFTELPSIRPPDLPTCRLGHALRP